MSKRLRLEANIINPPIDGVAGAAKAIQDLREKQQARSLRFGIPSVPLTSSAIAAVGTITKEAYLALTRSAPEGSATFSGIDVSGEEERQRAAKRAERFGIATFDYAKERQRDAGLSEEAIRLRAERRERAARFGQSDPLDIEIAKAAFLALGSTLNSQTKATVPSINMEDASINGEQNDLMDVDSAAQTSSSSSSEVVKMSETETETSSSSVTTPTEIGTRRPTALHMRAYKYLPASTADIEAFFSPLKPTLVEWLNGDSVNLIFQDEGTAKRALELYSEPVPICVGIETVHPDWRICLRPLVKMKTDKYAPEGAETTVYLRFATSLDTKSKAVKTQGARSQGTYSKEGLYSKKAIQKDVNAARRGQLASYDRAPLHVAAMVAESLETAAAALLQAQQEVGNANREMDEDEADKSETVKVAGDELDEGSSKVEQVGGPTTLRIEVVKERIPSEKRFGGIVKKGGLVHRRMVVREKLGEGVVGLTSSVNEELFESEALDFNATTAGVHNDNDDDDGNDRRLLGKRKNRYEEDEGVEEEIKRESRSVDDAALVAAADAANVVDATSVVAANIDSSFDVDKALAEAEEIEARL
jgi:hypothetical protein